MDPKTGRTSGDGMEQEAIAKQDIINTIESTSFGSSEKPKIPHPRNNSIPGDKLIYKPRLLSDTPTLPSVVPRGKIFNLVPKLVPIHRPTNINKREPKFVPFEPYKAAVNPLIPYGNSKMNPKIKIDRNNLDLNVLISQMSQLKATEMGGINVEHPLIALNMESSETLAMKKEIEELKKERDYYAKELKFQSQVNSELKKLLVAAVGEDIQTKVNVLTEDKLQLARALLDTAKNLSSHTEQIEFLAGQSEVWRSKFLASSLMVEELARWKASLTQKNDGLFTSNKILLETISYVRNMSTELLKNMIFITRTRSLNLRSSNVLDISAELINLSQQLVLHSGIGIPENLNLNGLDPLTPAEKLAIEALENTSQPLMQMDDAFKAIFNKAFKSNMKNVENEIKNESGDVNNINNTG